MPTKKHSAMEQKKLDELRKRLSEGNPISFKPSVEDQELILKLMAAKPRPLSALVRDGLWALKEQWRVY
jgi:hypothetical protein